MPVMPNETMTRGYDGSLAVDASWLDALSHSVVIVDGRLPNLPIVLVNQAFTELTGYGPDDAIGRNCRFLQGPNTDVSTVARMRDALSRGQPVHEEILNYKRDGREFWNKVQINPICNEGGKLAFYIGVQHDVSEKRAAVERALRAERCLKGLAAGLVGFVFQFTRRGRVAESFSVAGEWLAGQLGLSDNEAIDWDRFLAVLHPLDRDSLLQAFTDSGRFLTPLRAEFRLVAPDGSEHWLRAMAMPRTPEAGLLVWDGLALDVQAEKSSESRLAYLLGYDPLTGLSNRFQLRGALARVLNDSELMSQRLVLFYIGLEEFQSLNDALGRQLGDQLLRRVAVRLQEFADKYGGTAARLAEDEFGLLLCKVPTKQRMREIADSIMATIAFPSFIDGHEICLQLCIGGVLLSPDDLPSIADEERTAELLKQAHLALHMARQEGAGAYRLYTAAFDDRIRNRVVLSQSLQRAITEEQFELHYQPVVDLDTGNIVGAEALVRWNHPRLGWQRPDVFIPLAESSGLIVPLGNWVMRQAMRQVLRWAAQGIKVPRIAINLSSVQLRRPGLIAGIQRALRETCADPACFGFELTEGVFIESTPEIHQQLETLRAMGFELALDDFGTGHSTFKYLRDFPVQKIKIDQTFIRRLVNESSNASIVRAIIAVCRQLETRVVAEGIETQMQREFLHSEGCAIGQGYLFSMPMGADDFARLLNSHITLPRQPGGPDRSVLGLC